MVQEIATHYKALPLKEVDVFYDNQVIDIESLIGNVLHSFNYDKEYLNKTHKFFIKDDLLFIENPNKLLIGKIRFDDTPHLFPTMNGEDVGAIINYCGREYIVYYDEEYNLCIGYNGALYCFDENGTYMDDYNELIGMIFENAIPNNDIGDEDE